VPAAVDIAEAHKPNLRPETHVVTATRGFLQKPWARIGLVDPRLYQARTCDVAMLVARAMRLSMLPCQGQVVIAQLGEHVERIDSRGVIVADPLSPGEVGDGADRQSADLAHSLRDRIRYREKLVGLFVDQQAVVVKVRPAVVPVKSSWALWYELVHEHSI
jgi:hypothetical protein